MVALATLGGCDRVLKFEKVETKNTSPRALQFDNSSSASDLHDFPVLVVLDPSRLHYDEVVDPTTDLRFSDGTADLAFDVELFDPTGESIVWVRVPTIHAGRTDEAILMYFGADAHGQASKTSTWRDYGLVYHGAQAIDAMPYADDNTDALPSYASGPIGTYTHFDAGTAQRVEFPQSTAVLDGWDAFTVELWLEPTYESLMLNGDEPTVLSKRGTIDDCNVYNSQNVNGAPLTFITNFVFTDGARYPSFYAPNQTWSYAAFAYDQGVLWSYRDGVADEADPASSATPLASGGNVVSIGGDPFHSLNFGGNVDELRISHTYHDADWVAAQYLSMTRHFVTFHDP